MSLLRLFVCLRFAYRALVLFLQRLRDDELLFVPCCSSFGLLDLTQ